MPTFRMRLDVAYSMEAAQRYRRQHPGATWSVVLKWAVGLPTLLLAAFFLLAKTWVAAAIFLVVLVALMFSRELDRLALRIRLRRSPWKNLDLNITLTDALITLENQLSEGTMKWPVISRAREY